MLFGGSLMSALSTFFTRTDPRAAKIRAAVSGLTLLGSGCFVSDEERLAAKDRDGDGHLAIDAGGDDCNDDDPDIHPGVRDFCSDNIDHDCDNLTCPARIDRTVSAENAWLGGSREGARLLLYDATADVDGDGKVDLLLVERGDAETASPTLVYQVPLTDTFPPIALEDAASATTALGELFLDVQSIGDLDGDGDAEVMLAVRGEETYFWVLDDLSELAFLDADTTTDLPRIRIGADKDASEVLGLLDAGVTSGAATGIGDWNNDGSNDWAAGAGGVSGTDHVAKGSVFIFATERAGEHPVSQTYLTRIDGTADKGGFGTNIVGGIDLNSDGLPDFVAYEPGYAPEDDGDFSSRYAGASYGFWSTPAGDITTGEADVTWTGTYDNSRTLLVQPIGDLNQDGEDDVAMYVGAGSGTVAMFCGPFEGRMIPEDADHKIVGEAGSTPTQGFGAGVHGIGDVDDDGYRDLLVDAPSEGLYSDLDDTPYQAGSS